MISMYRICNICRICQITIVCRICHTHTQASFNTMRYKGRDSASGIDRKLSIIRPGATTIVAPKSVGSMTTKGQMNPTSRVSVTASQAGENSQTNGREHTIVSIILTDLIFKEATEEEQYCRNHH